MAFNPNFQGGMYGMPSTMGQRFGQPMPMGYGGGFPMGFGGGMNYGGSMGNSRGNMGGRPGMRPTMGPGGMGGALGGGMGGMPPRPLGMAAQNPFGGGMTSGGFMGGQPQMQLRPGYGGPAGGPGPLGMTSGGFAGGGNRGQTLPGRDMTRPMSLGAGPSPLGAGGSFLPPPDHFGPQGNPFSQFTNGGLPQGNATVGMGMPGAQDALRGASDAFHPPSFSMTDRATMPQSADQSQVALGAPKVDTGTPPAGMFGPAPIANQDEQMRLAQSMYGDKMDPNGYGIMGGGIGPNGTPLTAVNINPGYQQLGTPQTRQASEGILRQLIDQFGREQGLAQYRSFLDNQAIGLGQVGGGGDAAPVNLNRRLY